VVEDSGSTIVSDTVTVLSVAPPVGPAVAPLLQVSLGVGGTVVKINAAENGTTWQVPTAPEMVIATDPGLGTPIVFLPVTLPAVGTSAVAYLDFRFGSPPTVGLALTASLVDIPMQLLDDGNGRLYVAESVTGFGPPIDVMTVSEITFGGGATPALTAAAIVSGVDAEFQDRMALGVGGASLAIAHSTGVDVLGVPGLGFIGTVPMPVNGAGTPYVPFTNILAGLPGPFDMLVFAGQPGGGGGHSYVSWSSVTGLAGPTGGIDPAGAALRPAPGFHEPAFTPTGPGTGTVTALLDTFPFGGGAGAIYQVPIGPAGPTGAVITPVLSPFGDPEPARNGAADPIGFQVGTAAVDFFGAVTAGTFGPIGSVSGLVPLTGFLNPRDSARPLAMSLPGFGGSDFALSTSIGTPSVHVFTVGAGPTVTATSTFPAGAATSLGTVWSQGAVGGVLPVHFQQVAGAAPGVMMQAGAPLTAPAQTFLASDVIGIAAIPFGGFVAVPPAQGLTPIAAAARTSLNFGQLGVLGSWATIHPSPGFAPPFPGIATIATSGSYGASASFYGGIGVFVTELASY
jgi:hypothetical protein